MSTDRLAAAHRLLSKAIYALRDVAGPGAGDDELLSVLTLCEGVTRRLDRVVVGAVAGLERRGVFTERGYRNPASALADLVGWERFEARRRTTAAEAVGERVGLDGATLPPRLPATASAFAGGAAGLRHVEVIARVLGCGSAGRLAPSVWAGAEAELAAKAAVYTPAELAAWGAALVEALDTDGPEPDERGPTQVNELRLTARRSRGGFLKGRFDDPALYDAIATVIDAKARPLTGDDDRAPAQRNAEALAEVCGFVLDHGDVPQRGGERPHLNVLIRLEDLEGRARSAMLDFGGTLTPESLRMLACDAAVIPIVMNGEGQPLDVGRVNRSPPATADARIRGAAAPRPGAKSITSKNGRRTGRPGSRTSSCCAAHITGCCTVRNGWCGSATGSRSSFPRVGWMRIKPLAGNHSPTSPPDHGRATARCSRERLDRRQADTPHVNKSPTRLVTQVRRARRATAGSRRNHGETGARPPARRLRP